VNHPPAPTTFEDFIQLIPARGSIRTNRFVIAEKPFELQIGRNHGNIVFLSFGVPDDHASYWPCTRMIESLTSQRAVWAHWQNFLADPDDYLTWQYIGKPGPRIDLDSTDSTKRAQL